MVAGKVVEESGAKLKLRYAKEYFVTEKGEIVKMAAIVTPHPEIRDML